MEKITEKVKCFLEKYDLLNSEKPVLIAFSGGFDSMCLLDVMSKLQTNIVAIHLNHNWRASESDKDENNCRLFCNNRRINYYSEKLSDNIKKTETAAREARYDFFEKCAKKFGSDVVLTAHNANDNAETVLYRIAKGTGTTGLCGISEKRGIFYRPLLGIKRAEIEEYCIKNKLSPNTDSSNDNVKYKRNLIRKNIIPEFEKINAAAIDTINSLSLIAKDDNKIINEYINTLKNPYNTENFTKYSSALQSRLIYNLFVANGLDYDKTKINRAINFINKNKNSKSGRTLTLSGCLRLFVSTKNIEIITNKEPLPIEIEIINEGEYKTPLGIFSIKKCKKTVCEYPDDGELCAYVDLSAYNKFKLRHRQDGDIIQPLGCNGTQKLKKYLNEKKIPAHKKDFLIFLTHKNEILWAPSLGLSEKIKVVTTPTHVLKFINKNDL